jgi:hypothetical protein
MYVNATTHPLNTFVLSPLSSSTNTATAAPAPIQDISQTLENIIVVSADYSKMDATRMPVHFEPQNGVWKEWLTPPLNQGSCGSCWSFASVSVLSDRFNIQMRRKYLPDMLSPLLPTVCNDLLELLLQDDPQRIDTVQNTFRNAGRALQNEACHGNSLVAACYYLQFYGTTVPECIPYGLQSSLNTFKKQSLNWGFPSTNSEFFLNSRQLFDYSQYTTDVTQGTCALYNFYSRRPFAYCSDTIRLDGDRYYGSALQHFQALFVYRIHHAVKNPSFLMMDIWRWGPLCSSFIVYNDFYDFDPVVPDAVYIHNPQNTQVVGGHAVELVGWGQTPAGTPFWWIKNSWGPEYGLGGYFRFLRGSDHCGIETNAVSMMPNLFYPLDFPSNVANIERRIMDLNIFHVRITDEYNMTLNKIAATFSPSPAPPLFLNSKPQNKRDPQNNLDEPFTQKQFPLLHFYVLSRMGYKVNEVLSPSGYNSAVYRTMPGIYTGTPHRFDPFGIEFIAGDIPTITKTRGNWAYGQVWWIMVVVLVVVVVVMVVVLLKHVKL